MPVAVTALARTLIGLPALWVIESNAVLVNERPVPAVCQSLSLTAKLPSALGRIAKLSFEHPIWVGEVVG